MEGLWVVCYLFLAPVLRWFVSSRRRYGRLVGGLLALTLVAGLSWIDCRWAAPVNHYTLLNVSPKATRAEIQSNFRRLSLRLHPDRNASPHANAAFLRLAQANDVLMNSRSFYDRFGDLAQPPTRDDQRWTVVETTLAAIPRYIGWFFFGWLYTRKMSIDAPRQLYFCVLVGVLAGEMLLRHGPEMTSSFLPPFEAVRWMRSFLAVTLHCVSALQAILVESPGRDCEPQWGSLHPHVRCVLLQQMLFELFESRVVLVSKLRRRVNNRPTLGSMSPNLLPPQDGEPVGLGTGDTQALPDDASLHALQCQHEPQTEPPDMHSTPLDGGGLRHSQSDFYRHVGEDDSYGRALSVDDTIPTYLATPLHRRESSPERSRGGEERQQQQHAPLHRHEGDTDCGPSPLLSSASPAPPPPAPSTITTPPADSQRKRRLRDAKGALQRMNALLSDVISTTDCPVGANLPGTSRTGMEHELLQLVQRLHTNARKHFARHSKPPGFLDYLTSPFVILLIWQYGSRFVLSTLSS